MRSSTFSEYSKRAWAKFWKELRNLDRPFLVGEEIPKLWGECYREVLAEPINRTYLRRRDFIKKRGVLLEALITQRGLKCQRCGGVPRLNLLLHVHHKDGDPQNNHVENLELLCSSCHRRAHHGEEEVQP